MLQFCEKYADPLLLQKNESVFNTVFKSREVYKQVLLQLEQDVKVDQEETKARIRSLMEGDGGRLFLEDREEERQKVIDYEI